MLQKTIDHASDADSFGNTRHPWPQAADAAVDDLDRHASLTRAVQGFDHSMVDQRIELCENSRWLSLVGERRLVVDQLDCSPGKIIRSDYELSPLMAL
jgi:hypothetical protein